MRSIEIICRKEKYDEALKPNILEYNKIGKKTVLNTKKRVYIMVFVLSD